MLHNTIAMTLVTTYVFAFFVGFGLYELLVPAVLKPRYMFALLAPGLGFLLIAIIDGYLIGLSLPIALSIPIVLAFGSVMAVAAVVFRGKSLVARFRSFEAPPFLATAAFSVMIVLILAPSFRAGLPTTPYRIGIDQVGYAEAAQYLVEGGTLARAAADLKRTMGTSDLRLAKYQNSKSLDYPTSIDSEFLLKALRWGFPGVIATVSLVTHSQHVYQCEFLLLIFNFGLLLGVCFFILRSIFGLPAGISLLFVGAMGLNCNLLNIYYEGQLAQIFTMPYILLILVLFHVARTWEGRHSLALVRSPEVIRTIALFGLLVAGMFSAYNEAMLLVGGFFYLAWLLDLIIRRRTSRSALLFTIVGLALGFALMPAVSSQWILYTFANLAGLASAGFSQPHWASPAEMLGLFDMYRETGYVLVPRSSLNLLLNAGVSVVVVFLACFAIGRDKTLDRAFWIAPIVLVVAGYVKIHMLDGISNYSYTKIYTLLLPLLIIPVFVGGYRLIKLLPEGTTRSFVLPPVAIIVTGALYIAQYLGQGSVVDRDQLAMYHYDGERAFAKYAIETRDHKLDKYMLTSLVDLKWIDQDGTQKVLAPELARPVALLLSKTALTCVDCFAQRYKADIVFSNTDYFLVNFGKSLRAICVPMARQYTVATLDPGAGPRAQWTALPSAQCDYSLPFALKFVKPLGLDP